MIVSQPCRSCGGGRLESVLDLGRTPLANALLSPGDLDQPERTFPLELAFCPDCALVQILETVPPDDLFGEYLYQSSWSETMLAHAESLAGEIVAARSLTADHFVIEAASNDGYLLQFYQRLGVPVLGIEPARNIAAAANERGIPTRVDFFGDALAGELRSEGCLADVFHAHNVLAHVADLNGFVRGIARVLSDDGVAVVEAPYVRDLVEHREFDTIYHEHLCYFSLTALVRLFARHGLVIHDVGRVAIHGGSLRLYASRRTAGVETNRRVHQLLAEEHEIGLTTSAYYRDFAARVEALKRALVETLERIKSQGGRIAAYGASAKGSTLLNYCGIGQETLDYVVDRSTLKQGRFTPGKRLAIYAPDRLLEDRPDYLLLLTWNFAEEVLRQQDAYRRRGGRFIIPVPEVRVA